MKCVLTWLNLIINFFQKKYGYFILVIILGTSMEFGNKVNVAHIQ